MINLIDFDFINTNVLVTERKVVKQYKNTRQQQLKLICNVSKVNLFIGENNTGKSRSLREIFKSRILDF